MEMDINRILTVQDKLNGFSIDEDNDFIYLQYNGLNIAEFKNSESEELITSKIRNYMDINKLLMESSKSLSEKFYSESEKWAKEELCPSCPKVSCRSLCKKAKAAINAVYFNQWLVYSQEN